MAEETVAQFLGRRERELIAQISALRGQLAPKETELAHVQHMRSFLPGGTNAPPADGVHNLAKTYNPPDPHVLESVAHLNIGGVGVYFQKSGPATINDLYTAMTIKELTIQALLDHFPLGGTVLAIREFIRDAYGRNIEPGSMRSQMHRLKSDKILQHDAEKDRWDFATGKRALYDTYRQIPSAKAMPELQDDNPEDNDSGLLEAARNLAWNGDGFPEQEASNNPPEAKPPGGIKRRF